MNYNLFILNFYEIAFFLWKRGEYYSILKLLKNHLVSDTFKITLFTKNFEGTFL